MIGAYTQLGGPSYPLGAHICLLELDQDAAYTIRRQWCDSSNATIASEEWKVHEGVSDPGSSWDGLLQQSFSTLGNPSLLPEVGAQLRPRLGPRFRQGLPRSRRPPERLEQSDLRGGDKGALEKGPLGIENMSRSS